MKINAVLLGWFQTRYTEYNWVIDYLPGSREYYDVFFYVYDWGDDRVTVSIRGSSASEMKGRR